MIHFATLKKGDKIYRLVHTKIGVKVITQTVTFVTPSVLTTVQGDTHDSVKIDDAECWYTNLQTAVEHTKLQIERQLRAALTIDENNSSFTAQDRTRRSLFRSEYNKMLRDLDAVIPSR
jgi:peptidoglycan hydrolase CwlO-like protein